MSAHSVPSVPRDLSQLSRRKQATHPAFVSVRALLNRARNAAGGTDSAKTSASQLGSALWEEWKKNNQRVQLGIFKLAQDQAELLRMGQQTASPNQIVEKCRVMRAKDARGIPFPIYKPKTRKPIELKDVVRSEQSARACLTENSQWNKPAKKEMVAYWRELKADAGLQTQAYRILKAEQAKQHAGKRLRTSSVVLEDLAALVKQLPRSPSPRVSPVASRSHTASSHDDGSESSAAYSDEDGHENSSDEDGDEYGSDRDSRPWTPHPTRGSPSGLVSYSPSRLPFVYHASSSASSSPSSSPRAAVPDEAHRSYVPPLAHRQEFEAFVNTRRGRDTYQRERDYRSIGRRAAHIYGTTRERWAAGEGW